MVGYLAYKFEYDNIIPVADQESNLSVGYFLGLTSITQFLPGCSQKNIINFLLQQILRDCSINPKTRKNKCTEQERKNS